MSINSINEYKCKSCTFDELVKIRDFVKKQSLELGANEQVSENIALSVDEVVTNLIEHGFKSDCNYFNLKIKLEKNLIIIEIEDNGITFDPEQIEKPDMEKYFKEFKKGGLGIHIIKSLMDYIEYIPASNSRKYNVLKLKKNIT